MSATANETQMIQAMLDAASNGDMTEAIRLQSLIQGATPAPGYTDDIQISAWGDSTHPIPNPDAIEDRDLATAARRARAAVAAAETAQTLTAHIDAAAELRRVGYPRHAAAIMILAKRLPR